MDGGSGSSEASSATRDTGTGSAGTGTSAGEPTPSATPTQPSAPTPATQISGYPNFVRSNTGDFSDEGSDGLGEDEDDGQLDFDRDHEVTVQLGQPVSNEEDTSAAYASLPPPTAIRSPASTSIPPLTTTNLAISTFPLSAQRRASAISLHPPVQHLEAFRAPPDQDIFRVFRELGRSSTNVRKASTMAADRDDNDSISHRSFSMDGSSATAAAANGNELNNGSYAAGDNDLMKSAAGSPELNGGSGASYDVDQQPHGRNKWWALLCPPPEKIGSKLWEFSKSVLPFLQWFPEYIGLTPPTTLDPTSVFAKPNSETWSTTPWYSRGAWRSCLKGDLVAGITVGVMVVPQGMAYATLASLPPIYGLYSCLVPISLYVLTGTSREMSLGPVAVNALLLTSSLYPAVISLPQEQRLPTYLALVFATTLLTGIFSFAMGLLRLGLAVTFVGPPVMEGFTMGSIILIGLSQLEPLLGYSTGPPQPYIIPQLIQTFSSISKTQPAALIIGLASIAILLTMGRFKYTRWIPRPLFVTVVMTLISWGIHITQPTWGLPIVGEVPRGLPRIVVPVLNSETLATCAVPAILLAVLGFMQSFAVAIRYSEKRGYPVLPNQELMALGVCHIFSSFTQSLDATGSYSRTAVKANAGAKTQVTGLVELVILLLTLFVLTPLFYYIPKSALAAIVMSAVINMFEPSAFRKMLRAKPRDFWVAVLTAVITVFASSQYGLLAGVAISLLLIVWRSSHPPTAELGLVSFPMAAEGQMNVQTYRNVQRYPEAKIEPGILVWRFDAELWFANVSYFREKLQEALAKRKGGSKGAVVPPVWEQREEVVVDTTTGSGAGEVDGEQGDLGLGITVDNTNNGTLPAPKPAAAPPIVVVDDHKVRVLVLDLSSVNDVDSSGAQALLALNTTLRKSQGIEILFAGVKGPVRDVLWRATGGRILPEGDGGKKASEPTKKKGSKKADSSTSPTATNGGAPASSSNQPPTEPELLPDEPPLDGAVPVIALEDLHGNITVVPHPAPETLTMPSGSPELPHGHRRGSFFKKNLHMVPNNTVIGAGWMQPVATTGLYVEQFFLNVAGAVEFAKKIVQRQKAKELKAMREEV